MFEENLVGLDDAEIGIVRQDDVVDGVESVHPLALRTQHLLQQPEVLDRDCQLPRAGLEEFEFFRSPVASGGRAEQEKSYGRLLATDGSDHRLPDLGMGEGFGSFAESLVPFDDLWLV